MTKNFQGLYLLCYNAFHNTHFLIYLHRYYLNGGDAYRLKLPIPGPDESEFNLEDENLEGLDQQK